MPLRHRLDLDRVGAHPRWQVITSADLDTILRLIEDGRPVTAIKGLQSLTGCGLADAKHAFDDVSLGHEFRPPVSSTPCPECGVMLRTDAAQQCLECGADCHSTRSAAF